MNRKPKILVVGSIIMDLLLLTKRVPLPGETILSEKYQFGPGGKGSNQAVASALMGGDTTFVCKVGDDEFGKQLQQSLINKGVSVDYVSVNPNKQSGFCVIMLEDGGNNRLITHLASNADLSKADIDRAFEQEDYDGMIIQFETSEESIIYACDKARAKGIPIIVDAGPSVNFPLEKIRGLEILSPNETETATLCGVTPTNEIDGKKAAEILAERSGAKHIVLKMGDKGSMHYTNGQIMHYPSHKVNAVDATAAGDVFTAAMAVQYLQHGDIGKAIKYANIAGALTVTKVGAQDSIPTAQDVAAFGKAE